MQEIELSTGDFRASSAFAEGLLACAAHAGNWLQSIRVVQTLPGRQCSPKVVYGDKGTRLEMYRGAQVSLTDGVTCAAHVGLKLSSSYSSRHHQSSSAAPDRALKTMGFGWRCTAQEALASQIALSSLSCLRCMHLDEHENLAMAM